VGYQIKPGHYLLTMPDIARYMVIEGKEILIDIGPSAEIEDVKVFLYASVFGALSHLRKVLPIHASAIAHNDGVYLFAGNSGAGKSTTVAEIQNRGYDVITDDLTPITFTEDALSIATCGIGRIKLWSDALEKLNIPYTSEDRIRGELEKFHVGIRRKTVNQYFQGKKIFILEPYPGEVLQFKSLNGKEGLTQFIKQTFRYQLFKQIKLIQIKVPRAAHKLNELGDWIEENIDL
jgi:hypothetical protein